VRFVETIIVGGGPGGSSCAWELQRHGRECLVLERKPMPRLKLCAGWVTPKVLTDLAIDPANYPHGLVKLEPLKVFFGRGRRFAKTVPGPQYSIRRIEFDAWLLRRSGAEVALHTVHRVAPDGDGYVIDDAFRCSFLIGAGGTHCPVKKALFEPDQGDLIVTQEVEFETPVTNSTCVLWFPYAESWGYAWYVPKANAVNIGFGGRRSRLEQWDRGRLWADFLGLLRKEGCLGETPPPEPKGYSYYVGRRRSQVRNGNAFLIGDAAGLATEDLAEGIGPAVESGLLAAREILGQGKYSPRSVTRYSMPFLARGIRNLASLVP
jgi:flavin-dependent dehydrogenase